MNNNNQPIGIFDSGVGGLSVLSELKSLLPNERYIYFGDSANVPYGEKTPEQLLGFSKNILDWFATQNVKMVIMACNTSSAVTLPYFKDQYEFEVLGLIEPITKFISAQKYSNIAMIATSATVKSNAYKHTLQKYCQDKRLLQIACPGLVELVENHSVHTQEAEHLVRKYVEPIFDYGCERIILGCTHYPFLSHIIEKIAPQEGMLLNPAKYLAQEAFSILKKCSGDSGSVDFYTSKNSCEFVALGQRLYPEFGIQTAELLELNQ